MQFTKPMIELVYELRKLAPPELKPSIKLANPELFDELKKHFHQNANAVSKALIKELFLCAGPEWTARLEKIQAATPKQSVWVYRGQTMFEDRALKKTKSTTEIKKRVYRGQVVSA